MRAWMLVLPLFSACAGDKDGDTAAMGEPAITSFTLDPSSGPPGTMVQSTLMVEHFEFTGGEHGDGTHMGPPAEVSADNESAESGHGLIGHVHIYWDNMDGNPVLMQVEHEGMFMVPMDATAGSHPVLARLHDADHLIVKPEVVVEMPFAVTE